MPDYRALYAMLFKAMDRAVDDLENGDSISAMKELLAAMREVEEEHLRDEDY